MHTEDQVAVAAALGNYTTQVHDAKKINAMYHYQVRNIAVFSKHFSNVASSLSTDPVICQVQLDDSCISLEN